MHHLLLNQACADHRPRLVHDWFLIGVCACACVRVCATVRACACVCIIVHTYVCQL